MQTLAEWSKQDTVLMGIGVLIIGYVMFRGSKMRLNRLRGTAVPSADDRARASRQAGGVHDQLDHVMLQLEELARSTTAQIETRFAKLEILLAEADTKIAQLQTLLATLNARPVNGSANALAGDVIRPEHRRIHDLADAGRSPVEIAQEVGRDVGEVELILALRKKN